MVLGEILSGNTITISAESKLEYIKSLNTQTASFFGAHLIYFGYFSYLTIPIYLVLLNLFINSSTGILKAIVLYISYFSLSPYGYDVIIGNAFHILISIIIFIFAASLWRTVFEKN